ncbi:MAG TPA: ATP-binding cassette domain-containing protein, partial [Chthoniobacterales bacterium]
MNLLEVERLNVRYGRRPGFLGAAGTEIQAAVGVSFCIRQGTTLGLVGESGSGKSTVARAILGLEEIASGEIVFGGDRISGLPEKAFRPYRKRIQMIFQDPFGSLDPRWTVGAIVAEPLQVHFPGLSRSERIDRTVGLLEK